MAFRMSANHSLCCSSTGAVTGTISTVHDTTFLVRNVASDPRVGDAICLPDGSKLTIVSIDLSEFKPILCECSGPSAQKYAYELWAWAYGVMGAVHVYPVEDVNSKASQEVPQNRNANAFPCYGDIRIIVIFTRVNL